MQDALERDRAGLPGSFVRLTNGWVHYELSGPEHAPTVVLIPGLSVPYSTWDRNARVLAAGGFRVLRYDHFGRGFSDRPRCRYDLSLHVGQLAELIAVLGLSVPLHLVGLSMGGPVSAAAAIGHPRLVKSLALIDPLSRQESLRYHLSRLPLDRETYVAVRGSILAWGQSADFLDRQSYEEFLPTYLPQLNYHGIERAVLSTIRNLSSWPLKDIFSDLGRSKIPVLLFWGRGDAVLPFEQSGDLLSLLPGAEFRPVEGAGHVPHWEKPDEVNAALLEFFGRKANRQT